MEEIKNLVRRFLFVSGIIGCVLLFFCASITAKQRTEYNMYLSSYSVVTLKNQNKKLDMRVDRRQYSFDYSFLQNARQYEQYLAFSHLGSGYYLLKTAKELFLK